MAQFLSSRLGEERLSWKPPWAWTALDRAGWEQDSDLRRAIGPKLLTVFIIGDLLGAGIYALGAEVGGAIWTAFMAAFVLALFTAFAYAELVSG